MRLLKVLDRNRRVTAVPFQKTNIPGSVRLTLEECKASAWAIAPDGSRYRDAEAVNALVAAAPGNCGSAASVIPGWHRANAGLHLFRCRLQPQSVAR